MNRYRFTVKHDKGRHVVVCYANDLMTALGLLMKGEKCPEGAVVKIEISEV
jgi:hypothetical protein